LSGEFSPAVSTTRTRDASLPADANRRSAQRILQKLAALHGSIHNHFNQERTLISRQIFKDLRAAALTHGASSALPDRCWVGAVSEAILVCLTAPLDFLIGCSYRKVVL
jgi:hypothetical protein